MGGRLDATNVLMPLVSGITHIALDHQEFLGNDLVSIAKEKAGIIKPKIPVVIAPQTAEVSALLEETARRQNAPSYLVGREVHYTLERTDQTGIYLKLQWKDDPPLRLRVNLFGAHQAANAALAYGLLQTVKSQGFSWRRQDLEEGFNMVVWPGRMEYFPGPPRVLLDGAHNPDGVIALARGLNQLFPKQKFCVILGILDNRPVEVMATQLSSLLAGRLQRVYATTVPEAKAASCERMSRSFQEQPVDVVSVPDPAQALSTAFAELASDEMLVVTGSLYLVGYLRPLVLDCLAKKGGRKQGEN
jgi:dihydrofolate synthase/folylpolyglutamate synthase